MAKKVYIVAGHGNGDPGACGYGIQERDITLKQANLLTSELKRCGIEVKQSRTVESGRTETQYINEANAWVADLMVSIHFNAGGGTGFEIYHSVVGGTSKTLAENINAEIKSSGIISSRGVKTLKNNNGTDVFNVIRKTSMPAVLCEGAFIDAKDDNDKMKDDAWVKKQAVCYAKGICKTLGVTYKAEGTATTSTETSTTSKPTTPAKTTTASRNKAVTATYRVRTKKHGWLSEVKNLEDYAGYQDSPITDIAVKVSAGTVKYRVHVKGGSWLPWVTGYNTNDYVNGYAGNGKEIDAIEIYYSTPSDIRPFKRAKYRVAPIGGSYYGWQYDSEKSGGQGGFAGLGKAIGKVQVVIE